MSVGVRRLFIIYLVTFLWQSQWPQNELSVWTEDPNRDARESSVVPPLKLPPSLLGGLLPQTSLAEGTSPPKSGGSRLQ